MSKDRPIKSFRVEGERPFKSYNPNPSFMTTSSVLFADLRRQEQPLTLPSTLSGLMQHHQQHQPQHQQDRQRQQPIQQQRRLVSGQVGQMEQMYNDAGEYQAQQQQQGLHSTLLVMDPSINTFSYDDLDLDTDNTHMRSDLMAHNESLLQQHQQDLNIQNSAVTNNFIIPNTNLRPVSRGVMGGQDPLSMLMEPPMLPFSSALTRPSNMSSIAMNNGQFSQSSSMSFFSSPSPSPLTNRAPIPSTSTSGMDHFQVKQEPEDSTTGTGNPSSSPLKSPSHKEASADGFADVLKRGLKRSASECSPSAVSPQDKPSTSPTDEMRCKDKVQEESSKDPAYLEKRRKNNESAKRSREARRTKEELVAFRVISLEEENMKLRAEIQLLDKELDELRTRVYESN